MCNKFAYHFDVAGKSRANQTLQLLYLLKWSSRSVKWGKTCDFVPAVLFWLAILAVTAQISKPVLQNNLADLADAHVILARHFGMESCAYSALLETVNSEKYCMWAKLRLPQWWRPCPADVRAHLASFGLFSEKNRRSSISVSFLFWKLTVMQILERRHFCKKKKKKNP